MNKKLKNKNALITGGGGGIGQAIAFCFAQEGANIFICGRNIKPLNETAEKVRQFGVKVTTQTADVSDQKSVQNMINHALTEFKRIDILVNNAGTYTGHKFLDYTLDEFDQTIKVNLYSVFLVTQAILPSMILNNKGRIINIASTAGLWGTKNQSAYNASKHAVLGLTRCLALEMALHNINVNAICPGIVETGMANTLFEQQSVILGTSVEDLKKFVKSQIPLQRFLSPHEVADLALYLASDESIGMTGQSLSF